MSVRTDDHSDYVTLGIDAHERLRYAAVSLEDGEVLLYDREQEDAWIQTDSTVGIETMA